MAIGDLDGDGRLDVVFNNCDAKPAVLKNVTAQPGHWLEMRLVGDVTRKTPCDATGAIVFVTTGKLRQRQDVVSGASYASQNDYTVHFGLGGATSVDKVEVKWPNGSVESLDIKGVDRKITVVQGKGVVK
jgi:hypothetical protein